MHGRGRKGIKVTRNSHGDGRDRSIGLKNRGVAFRVVYRRLERRPVLLPAVPPDTPGRALTAAVRAVVEPKR
jgi:hypothetical protein